MNKEELIKKLAGDSFKEYLEACSELPDYAKNGVELNQEIIERALFVNLFPFWANHQDLKDKYDEIANELPNHSDLLQTDQKYDLMGLTVFVNGLMNGVFDVSGFLWASNGYMSSKVSCDSISEYYKEQGKDKEAAYFQELGEWFLTIYSATTDVFRAIMNIKSWNEQMVIGLTNFLNKSLSQYGIFEWILSGLYEAVDDPLIKEKVFDHYIDSFKKARENLKKEKNKEGADQITGKLKNLRKLAKGQNV
ncbi:hypothetical protein QWT87_10365 [Chryseobacterium sp. APV1]|uniref:DUF1266 domain-containing protein n=1 Tax=Chryseobacterium urinae TaxID=3058400 RepID=A0ABT8U2K5_9FLAO|nr:hypothetical protein [Chryseobacterium sp. APV1]MDO3425293.1 hypothetical protein [Chryseobacterium sp. APV1]